MKAWVFGGMLVLCGAVAACSSDSGDSSSSGSGGSGSSSSDSASSTDTASTGNPTAGTGTPSSSGASPDTTGVSTSVTQPTVGTSDTTGVSTASGGCGLDGFFGDEVCDPCLLAQCCAEAEACANDQANCLNADSTINPDSTLGGALIDCLSTGCETECGGGGSGICDTGLSFGDEAIDACLTENCCDEFHACSDADPQACIDCLNGDGGPLCDPAAACLEEFCTGTGSQICDTGLSFGDEAVDTCLGDACCAEFQACVADDPQACIDCVNDGGTDPLCADALACGDDAGCFAG